MPKWYQAKLIKSQDRSETTKSFWFEIDQSVEFDFTPGQFITLDLPIGEKRLDRWRSYSIANKPDGSNLIELVIVKVPFGKATTYLFDVLTLGESIKFKGPAGTFCLPNNLENELVFICTGTGVAPFRSMLFDLKAKGVKIPKTHLFFGTRFNSGILYLDEWKSLKNHWDNFDFSIALSREEYDGYKGYVHDLFLKEYSTPKAGVRFYLCGWQNMVDEAKEKLLNLGWDKEQIIEELYG